MANAPTHGSGSDDEVTRRILSENLLNSSIPSDLPACAGHPEADVEYDTVAPDVFERDAQREACGWCQINAGGCGVTGLRGRGAVVNQRHSDGFSVVADDNRCEPPKPRHFREWRARRG